MEPASNVEGVKTPVNTRIDLEQSGKLAEELLTAFKAGEHGALERVRWNHPRFRKLPAAEFQASEFALADAQLVIARLHHIESWPKLAEHVESMERGDPIIKGFEDAADAIVSGNLELLQAMVRELPTLVQERSTRSHNSTLLHYVSANGVENYRQITPPNIVEITRFLLDSGADVNAESNAYGGGSTTLGLTATSAHPRLAGVQLAMIDLLLDRGAIVGVMDRSGGTIHDCVANGCPEAALHLVQRCAKPDTLYGSASLGQLDVVQQQFPHATIQERGSALLVAAQCDHATVVEFMLNNGVDAATFDDGATALHWACANGNLSLMETMLAHGAPLEMENEFGGTVLDGTLWFAYHALPADFATRNFPAVIDRLIAAGARTDRYPTMQDDIAGVHERAKR